MRRNGCLWHLVAGTVLTLSALQSWAQLAPLDVIENPDPNTNDWFGRSTSICRDWVLIGTPGNDNPNTTGGGVYLYRHANGTQKIFYGLSAYGSTALPALGSAVSIGNDYYMTTGNLPPNPGTGVIGGPVLVPYERNANDAFESMYRVDPLYAAPYAADDGYTFANGDPRTIFRIYTGSPNQIPVPQRFRAIAWRNTDTLGIPNNDIDYKTLNTTGMPAGYNYVSDGYGYDINDHLLADAIVNFDNTRAGVFLHEIVTSGNSFSVTSHSYALLPTSEISTAVTGVSVDGDHLAIGVPLHTDPTFGQTGAVYMYQQHTPGTWTHTQTIVPSTLSPGDRFGDFIRIRDGLMLIGAPGDKYSIPYPSEVISRGEIHVYELDGLNSWTHTNQVLTPTLSETPTGNTAYLNFGSYFDFRSDLLIVGHPAADARDSDGNLIANAAGAAYVWAVSNDCNNNGIDDHTDIDNHTSIDFNLNGVPDECDISNGDPDCNNNGIIDLFESSAPADIVIVFDTSGSLGSVAAELCNTAGSLYYQLANNGYPARLTLMGTDFALQSHPGFSCITTSVRDIYCTNATIPHDSCERYEMCPGNSIENWALGTEIIADNYNWLPDNIRIVIPVSDVGAECDSCDSTPGGAQDLAIEAAKYAVRNNSVYVLPMIASSNACVIDQFQELAAYSQYTTNGSAIDVQLPNNDVLYDEIVALLSQFQVDRDCNDDGIPDDCQCLKSADLNHDGQLAPNDHSAWVALYNAQDPEADMNCDGMYSPADFSSWVAAYNSGYLPCN